jgi:hypothetical protein
MAGRIRPTLCEGFNEKGGSIMIPELFEVPDDFWKIYQALRRTQMLQLGYDGPYVVEFVESENRLRRQIDKEIGPEAAVFSTLKRHKRSTADPDAFYLKLPKNTVF